MTEPVQVTKRQTEIEHLLEGGCGAKHIATYREKWENGSRLSGMNVQLATFEYVALDAWTRTNNQPLSDVLRRAVHDLLCEDVYWRGKETGHVGMLLESLGVRFSVPPRDEKELEIHGMVI